MISSTKLGTGAYDVEAVRQDFPILNTKVRGSDLVYLDNAATTQKPQVVINALVDYYTHANANIHRAVHYLSEKATAMHDEARREVQKFLNARYSEEIIFVRGTTEAINLVAHSHGGMVLQPKDEIVISAMEHHSNIVPWQLAAERTGAVLRVIPMDKRGVLDLDQAARLLTDKTHILSLVHVSNALGTINPIRQLITLAHDKNIPVLIDGAQSAPHLPIDVQSLEADFFAFSGHKIYGPTGIGVLYGRRELLETMPPYQGGGDMISSVSFEESTWNSLPYKFEAGTPDIAGPIGLAAALNYVSNVGLTKIAAYETDLLHYATERLKDLKKVRIIGESPEKAGAISFIVEGVHPHDLGTFMDHDGVAIRTGHHCAQPVMDFYDIPATARLSLGMYNTRNDIDRFTESLEKTIGILS